MKGPQELGITVIITGCQHTYQKFKVHTINGYCMKQLSAALQLLDKCARDWLLVDQHC